MTQALFHRQGDAYLPTELAGSPWSPDHLHGGPPAGLLAHGFELQAGSAEFQLARLSVDLLRPVPRAPLRMSVEVVRAGRRMRLLSGSLWSEGVEAVRATALFLEQREIEVPEHARFRASPPPCPPDAPVGSLSEIARWEGKPGSPPGLHTTAEARRVAGVRGQGSGTVWMRLPVPVVAGVPLTPLVRVATLADFGNGVGQLRLAEDIGCINADITLHLHRLPLGEWLGLEAHSRMEPSGIGLVETVLYDETGAVGRVSQATLAMPVFGG
jgi:hypothetical protein